MGVVQMISRGFHRLGLFLAGYAFLMGFIYSIFFVPSDDQSFGLALATTVAISVAVYGVARATGWVIGGFAAS
jgi:hypothetical protein